MSQPTEPGGTTEDLSDDARAASGTKSAPPLDDKSATTKKGGEVVIVDTNPTRLSVPADKPDRPDESSK